MNNFKKLVIPFGTKSYLRKKNDGLVIMGDAVFIFNDKNKIIDEYLIIKKSNFRLTDKKMIKPTDYYKTSRVRNFRNNFLDKYANKKPEKIVNQEYLFLTEKQIFEVNEYFLNLNTTIKAMFSLLSGSNISGAERNPLASPIRCIDIEYYNCNFANVLKLYNSNKKEKTKNYDKNIPEYNLNQFLEKNIIPGFTENFNKYNKQSEEYEKRTLLKKKNFAFNENQETFIISVINKTIEEYDKHNSKNINNIKARLRSFYTTNVNVCLQNNIIPYSFSKEKRSYENLENAHIISFEKLIKNNNEKSLKDAISPFNCLRIHPDEHTSFDKGQIYFDMEGKIIDRIKQNQINDNYYLDINKIPKQTKEFLNRFLKENNLNN
ncbi:MAG: MAG4270 family putative restriction endonuclease [Metamycoplasmataceae bacterium]